jgi:16S rRNA (cytidine1402-2'-O)-methyltransferase
MPRERLWADPNPTVRSDTLRAVIVAGQRLVVPRAQAGLYIVATPIGHMDDISLRALKVLAGVDLIACEDTRVTGKLLERYGIDAILTPYHEHNAAEQRPKLLARLAEGAALALVSDAGTPLVSDPGYRLVQEAAAAARPVVPVPGPSAALAALVVAGLPTDRFFFEGFLPPKTAGRRERLDALKRVPASLVLFETGPRLAESLADMADVLGDRPAAICRELTKLHETVTRGPLGSLAESFAGTEPKGEIVVVVGPPPAEARASASDMEEALANALARLSVKDAAAEVAASLGLPKREVYARALDLRAKGGR